MHIGTVFSFAAGRLVVDGWPQGRALLHGLVRHSDGRIDGPARLRRAVRTMLGGAALPWRDLATPTPVRVPPPPPPFGPELGAVFANWLATGEGIVIGLPLAWRAQLVQMVAAALSVPTLVAVPDTGAVAAWLRALAPALGGMVGEHRQGPATAAVKVATAAAAAKAIAWLGGRAELLAIDGLELLPLHHLGACTDGAVALLRLGFAAAPGPDLLQRSGGIGPVLSVFDAGAAPRTVELRMPLTATERLGYEAAWHEFFAAFDRFSVLRPKAGFAEFVRWARADPAGRPGLLAWHRALRIASWTEHKASAVAALLERHRGARILVFTPDCETAYALSRQHLIAPVTAELPRGERDRALAGFGTGALRVLAGPRLLETGVEAGNADVGIVVGASVGRAQRGARVARVHRAGLVCELLSQDTMEVGRASRLRGTAAATPVAMDQP